MQSPPPSGPPSPSDRVAALVEALLATLRLARVLAQSQRRIDLAGLDQEVGRLCAAALDLPPTEGQAMRPHLAAVLAELNALSACVAALTDDQT
jgi:hypothetical protein